MKNMMQIICVYLIEKYKLSNNQLIGHKRDKLLKDKNQRLDFIQIINIFKYLNWGFGI